MVAPIRRFAECSHNKFPYFTVSFIAINYVGNNMGNFMGDNLLDKFLRMLPHQFSGKIKPVIRKPRTPSSSFKPIIDGYTRWIDW
jgi:hypothetical protein